MFITDGTCISSFPINFIMQRSFSFRTEFTTSFLLSPKTIMSSTYSTTHVLLSTPLSWVYTQRSFTHCLKLCPNRCLSNLFTTRQNWGWRYWGWRYHFKGILRASFRLSRMLRASFGHSRNLSPSCLRMVFKNSFQKCEGTDPLGLFTDRCWRTRLISTYLCLGTAGVISTRLIFTYLLGIATSSVLASSTVSGTASLIASTSSRIAYVLNATDAITNSGTPSFNSISFPVTVCLTDSASIPAHRFEASNPAHWFDVVTGFWRTSWT